MSEKSAGLASADDDGDADENRARVSRLRSAAVTSVEMACCDDESERRASTK
jgi:hypothetical protein